MSAAGSSRGDALKGLAAAIADAFNEKQLEQAVYYSLDVRLFNLVPRGSFSGVVFDLITWADTNGRLLDLGRALVRANPDNTRLASSVAAVESFGPGPFAHEDSLGSYRPSSRYSSLALLSLLLALVVIGLAFVVGPTLFRKPAREFGTLQLENARLSLGIDATRPERRVLQCDFAFDLVNNGTRPITVSPASLEFSLPAGWLRRDAQSIDFLRGEPPLPNEVVSPELGELTVGARHHVQAVRNDMLFELSAKEWESAPLLFSEVAPTVGLRIPIKIHGRALYEDESVTLRVLHWCWEFGRAGVPESCGSVWTEIVK